MARAAVDKPYVNFSNGLVTEVTKLSYPENSLLDVENMDIDIDGSVRRRLGIEPEINARPFFVNGNPAVSAHVWENPGGAQGIKLVVTQVVPIRRSATLLSTVGDRRRSGTDSAVVDRMPPRPDVSLTVSLSKLRISRVVPT